MYVYVHFEMDPPNGLAFHKETTAVEYVIEKIEENIGIRQKKAEQPKPVKTKKKLPYAAVNRFTVPQPARPMYMDDAPQQPAVPVQLINPIELGEIDPPMSVPSLRYQDYISQLSNLINKQKSETKEDPKYINALKEQIAITNASKTIANANKLIQQYDIYMKETFGVECPLHTIQEIGVI